MIGEEQTKSRFGYTSDSLPRYSAKSVVVYCDYCGAEYVSPKKALLNRRKDLDKDCCRDCRFIKRKEVSLKKYGVANSAQRQDVRDKISRSNADRLRSDEFKELAAKSNRERYGSEIAMRSEIVKNKVKSSILEKYGVDNISKVKEIRERANRKSLETRIKNGNVFIYDGKTYPNLAKDIGFSRSHFGKLVKKYGIEVALTMTPQESSLERVFREWLEGENIEYIRQFRVGDFIADFKIGNLLIEVDGLYWHSDINHDRNYHAKKQRAYKEAGYSSFFFRQDEIENKFDIVKSVTLNRLGRSSKIMARKCEIREVGKNDAKEFLVHNHLMGAGKGTAFGLYYEGELVSLLLIKRIKGGHEISRFCNRVGLSITGGFSRLLRASAETLNVSKLITFIDKRYGEGKYLESLGFNYISCYTSFKWTDGHSCWGRMSFPGKSGYEKGLRRIWDCGQAKYCLNID